MREVTRTEYTRHAARWVARWDSLADITERAVELYVQERLGGRLGKTVASDVSALRGLLRWAVNSGHLAEAPDVPRVHSGAGVKSTKRGRARAPELTPAEIRAVIAALPEHSRHGKPVRARALVSYLTTLRPTTIGKLRVPDHYSKGSSVLRVTADIDKEGNDREVPLTEEARDALDSVCPEVGIIFGEHEHRRPMHRARRVLPPHKARIFGWQHFRSAGITHWLERSLNLPGVQYLAGHLKSSTTARYTRPSFRAALEVVSTRGTALGDSRRNRKKRRA